MLPLLIIVLILTACGISTYIYIYPPIYNGITLSFSHNANNNKEPNFLNLGYDIYYRIYDNSSVSQFNGLSDLEKVNILKADADIFFSSGNTNKLITRNFSSDFLYKPIKHYSNDKDGLIPSYSAPPILPIDNSESVDQAFSVYIRLAQTDISLPYLETTAPYSSTTLPEIIEFRRYLTDNKDFSNYVYTDDDINFPVIENKVLVTFFVISYGFSVDYYTLTSDKPIYIGFTELIGD